MARAKPAIALPAEDCDLGRPKSPRKHPMGKPAQIDIVRRAYQLWQQAGEPRGSDEEFYHQAEKELQEALDKSTPKTHG
jgi:hypothetical protein